MKIVEKEEKRRDLFEEIGPEELERAYEKSMAAIRGFVSEVQDLDEGAQHAALCMLVEALARKNGSDAVENAEIVVEAIKNKRRVFGNL